MIQLPDDVKAKGYRKIGAFKYEQVFESEKYEFTGTEKEFVAAGHGYEYIQIDEFKRAVIK